MYKLQFFQTNLNEISITISEKFFHIRSKTAGAKFAVKKLTCMISMKVGQNDSVYWFIIDNFFDVNKSFLGSLMTFKSVDQYTTLIPFFKR